jgi:succinoglycan biosynthesis protein ExoA
MNQNLLNLNVSVIVVCYNEEKNIAACLNSLVSQDYRLGEYEIIVVDGGSTDGTLAIARDYAQAHTYLRIIIEPRRGTAVARNTGIKATRFSLIAFCDADCIASENWLSSLVCAYRDAREKDTRIVAVGGPSLISAPSPPFVEALKIALDTYIGSGGRVTGKHYPRERPVIDLPSLNILYGKDLFDEIGYFDVTFMDEGEDADLSYRIIKAGKKLWYSPRPVVYHKFRPDLRSWWRNMRRYGRARGRLLSRDPAMANSLYLTPILLVLSLLFVPLAVWWLPCAIPLLYFPLMFILSIYISLEKRRPKLIWLIFIALCSTHLGYGIGEIEGLVRGVARRLRVTQREGK